MSEYEEYIEEQEGRLRELESKVDMVTTRAGMVQDAGDRALLRELMAELNGRMRLFRETIEELHDAGSAWEDMKDSVEKAYLNVKESLQKASGGLIK